MNTSRQVRKCRRSESGVTIVELAIVMVIMGLLALLVTTPLQMTNQLSRTTLDRMVDAIDTNLSIRLLTQHISNSQLVRSPAFTCTGLSQVFSKPVQSLDPKTDTIQLLPGTDDHFSIPFISASSTGAIAKDKPESIYVTDPGLYMEGDMVAVISAENSKNVGVFEVVERSIPESRLRLRAKAIKDDENDCSLVGGGTTLNQFTTMSSTGAERTLLVQRFHIAIYKVVNSDVTLRMYPQNESGEGARLFSNFESVTLKPLWQPLELNSKPSGASKDVEIAGTFWTVANIVLLEKEIDQTRNQLDCKPGENRVLSESFKCQNGILNRIRRFATYGRYVMSSTERLNLGVQTNAVPKKDLFPTCLVVKTAAGIGFKVPEDMKQKFVVGGDRSLVYVTGAFSEPALGQTSMNIAFERGSEAICINRSDFEKYDSLEKDDKARVKIKMNESFDIEGTSFKMDEYLCSTKGKTTFTGTLYYFDPGTMSKGRATCTEVQTPSVMPNSVFEFVGGAKPTCQSNGGTCSIPEMQDVVTKKTLETKPFYTARTCTWSNGVVNDACCEANPPTDPNVKLISVKYETTLKLSSGSKEVTARCTN